MEIDLVEHLYNEVLLGAYLVFTNFKIVQMINTEQRFHCKGSYYNVMQHIHTLIALKLTRDYFIKQFELVKRTSGAAIKT